MKRFEYEDAIDKSGLPMVQRAILRHVARRAVCQGGDLGDAWPSVADIVDCTGAGRRTVIRALLALREAGWLVARGTRRQVTVYQCQIGTGATAAPDQCQSGTGARAAPVPERHLTGATAARGGCHSGTGPVPQRHTEASQEAFLEAPQEAPPPVGPPGPTPREPDQPTLLEAKPMIDVHWHAAIGLWRQFLQASGRSPSAGPAKSSKTGQALLRALRDDHDEVLDALRWAAFGDDWNVRKNLRGNKACTIMTPLRHLDRYAALWREHGDTHIPDGNARDRGADALRQALDELGAPSGEDVADGVTYEDPDTPRRRANDDFWL